MRKLNLVILDDDPAILRLVELYLNNSPLYEQLQIVSFGEPAEALAWIQTNTCDILLSDIEMPGYTGLEMHREAKLRNPWTQTLLLTAYSTWDRINEAVEAGANDYLLKPINKLELLELVSQAMNRFHRWQSAVVTTFSQTRESTTA